MNLSSIFDWMDLLIFVLAILGTIGVVYAGIQLYQEDSTALDTSSATTNKNQQSFPPKNKASVSLDKKKPKPLDKTQPEKLVPDAFVEKVLGSTVESKAKAKEPSPFEKSDLAKKLTTDKPIAKPPLKKTTQSKPSFDKAKEEKPKVEKVKGDKLGKENPKEDKALFKKSPKDSPITHKKAPAKTPKPTGYANPVIPEPKKKRSFFSFWKKEKDNNQAEKLGQIMTPSPQTASRHVYPAPELIPEKLTLKSPEALTLMLKVKGNKIVYQKLSHGSYNELKIEHQTSLTKLDKRKNDYPAGNSLVFTLKGPNVTSKTYQFSIYFKDTAGNTYSQQIAGLGKEYPIVEKPVKVG